MSADGVAADAVPMSYIPDRGADTHHDKAVEVAAYITAPNSDVPGMTRQFANEIVIFQRWEIGIMDTVLDTWGIERGNNTTAMG